MAEKANLRCGRLFLGSGEEIHEDFTIEAVDGVIQRVAPSRAVPKSDAKEYDFSQNFVVPGLIDVHTHLAYGNAKTEEDIDLYGSMEFRTLRGMLFAHQVLAAGFTSMAAPGGSGNLSTAIRDAIDAGLFEGPSITASGPYITSRQGLTDWYPTWIGVPSTSIGRLVRSRDEAIEEIRRQVKDGVDSVKIALDGLQRRPDGEYVAAFTLEETKAMVDEIHRLGKMAITHARGREATLYSAKAGVDLIFHASYMDNECLDEILANKCKVSPSLTLLANSLEFSSRPQDPAYRKKRNVAYSAEFEMAVEALRKARKAGVPMPIGTDSGFAVTPFGEWHARELEIYVEHLGFEPIEALQAATSVSASVLRPQDRTWVGTIAPGYRADVVALEGDPTRDISILLDKTRIKAIHQGAKPISAPRREYDPRRVSDFAMTMFSDHFTRDRVIELGLRKSLQ